jgi:hypothetical protein
MTVKRIKGIGGILLMWWTCGPLMGQAEEATVLQVIPGEGRPSAIVLGTGENKNTLVAMPTAGEIVLASGVQNGVLPPRRETPKVESGRWQTASMGSGKAKDPAVKTWLGAVAQLQPRPLSQSRSASPNDDIRMQEVVRAERVSKQSPVVETTPAQMSPAAMVASEDAPEKSVPVADVTLRLELNEVALLRDAASRAGGRLDWTIKLVGVKAEDLLVPLANSGQVRVFQDPSSPGRWVIASLTKDDRETKIRDEIARLEARRRELLSQVKSLESMSGGSGGGPR